MELLDDLYRAKLMLKEACKVMDGEGVTPDEKLAALARAIQAECSIDALSNQRSIPDLERKYNTALELKAIYSRCNREAEAAAQKAYKEAYSRVMAERFSEIPPSVREEMEVKLTSEGWEFTVEY